MKAGGQQLNDHGAQARLQVDFYGSLYNRRDLINRLGWEPIGPDDQGLLDAAWRRWGERLPEYLIGDYALVIRDGDLTFLARDPLGVKPLYYRIDAGRLTWGFSVPELRRKCPLPVTPDMDWAARYLLGLSKSTRDTAYREVHKLPPGHCLSLRDEGQPRLWRHHQWCDDAPPSRHRDGRWVEAYREVLEESIRCRMSDGPMGTENSGGIDSATITAYLARFLEGARSERLHAFGFARCDQEPAYILETSQAAGIVHNYIVTAHDPGLNGDEHVKACLAVLGYPEEHHNGSGHIPFYRECQRRGISTLFSGFGGDEVVTNGGWLLRRELADVGDYANLWNILPGNPAGRSARLIKTLLLDRAAEGGDNPTLLQAFEARWPRHILRPEIVDRLGLKRTYLEQARYDGPYRRINDFILQHHLSEMSITTRLENCTLMAAAHGVEYRWPLWDQRLVQQYLSTPSLEKMGPRGIGRYLHRRAIDGIVPARVAWKPSKHMGDMRHADTPGESRVIPLLERVRHHGANLHPLLAELVDGKRLAALVGSLAAADSESPALLQGLQLVNALCWLNVWLSDTDGSAGK